MTNSFMTFDYDKNWLKVVIDSFNEPMVKARTPEPFGLIENATRFQMAAASKRGTGLRLKLTQVIRNKVRNARVTYG